MKQLLIVCMVLAVAMTASAGLNPNIKGYISFDPAGDPEVNMLTPTAYTTVNAYLCLTDIGAGMTTISFRLNDALSGCPGVMATQQFVNLMPGNLMIGNPFDAVGATIASTDCMTMDPVIVGYSSYFYLGGACCIQLLDHGQYPRWIVDCQEPGQVDYYCVLTNGSVAGADCPPGDCPVVPVEEATWGGI